MRRVIKRLSYSPKVADYCMTGNQEERRKKICGLLLYTHIEDNNPQHKYTHNYGGYLYDEERKYDR